MKTLIEQTPTVEAALSIGVNGKGQTTLRWLQQNTLSKNEFAYRVLVSVIAVLNEGKEIKLDGSMVHYEPWFRLKSDFGLSYLDYNLWHSRTCCGVHLCYVDYDTMLHGVKILLPYYNDFLL